MQNPMPQSHATELLPVLWEVNQEGAGALECHVCLGVHDEQIHGATLSVRRWFHAQVIRPFRESLPADPEFLATLDGRVESSRPCG
jgi:hypothetical protein